MYSLTQLHHFRLVAITGNFAEAARQANITQPALSNSVRSFEGRTGLQLFDRSQRPIRLTPVGRDLLARVEALLASSKMLEREMAQLATGEAGHLKIGMTAHSSASIGGAALGQWHARNPRMRADVTVAHTTELLRLLREERLDLIVGDARDLPHGPSDVDTQALPQHLGAAFCRPGHPLLERQEITFHDLLPFRFAGAHFPVAVLDDLAETFGLRDRHLIEIAIECENIAVVRDATMQSDLILLTTSGCVRHAVMAGYLRELPVQLKTRTQWHVVTRKHALHHPALPKLRDVILAGSTLPGH